MQKNGYVRQDVAKAISGFCIILALIAALSLFSGIGKGNGGGSSNGSSNISSETVEPVQDELAGIWVFNNTPEWIGEAITFNVDFSLNGKSYSSIVFSNVTEGNTLPIHTGNLMSYGDTPAYFWYLSSVSKYFEGWQFDAYRAISITSKLAEVENGEKLLAYLQANAKKQNTSATELITFTIDETPYQAWAGMTWEEWANSAFDLNEEYSKGLHHIIKNGDERNAVSTTGVLVDILFSMEITANGEYKITREPEELPVWNGTDLTGTTWNIPSGWSAPSGYGKFSLNYIYDGIDLWELNIGYEVDFGEVELVVSAKSNTIMLGGYGNVVSSMSFTIQIIGGTDATNTSLISWLKQNGELTSHQMPIPTLISFTVDGTTYQAEEGMTWGDWCDSDYNTGYNGEDWIADTYVAAWGNNYVSINGSISGRVRSTDTIIADYAYSIYMD